MSLLDSIRNIAEAAMSIVSDLATSVTYSAHTANPVYDPATGTVTESTTDYAIDVILTSYEQREIDNVSIMGTDIKAMIASNDLEPTPTLKDTITIAGVKHEIVTINKDPAGAVWSFQLRKP